MRSVPGCAIGHRSPVTPESLPFACKTNCKLSSSLPDLVSRIVVHTNWLLIHTLRRRAIAPPASYIWQQGFSVFRFVFDTSKSTDPVVTSQVSISDRLHSTNNVCRFEIDLPTSMPGSNGPMDMFPDDFGY